MHLNKQKEKWALAYQAKTGVKEALEVQKMNEFMLRK
jgi:hypothetical protein